MLSSSSSLQNGRFRVIGLFGEANGGRLYDAFDDQLGQKVVIHETHSDDNFTEQLNFLKNRRVNGIVQIRDGFVEGSNAYLVTEALEGRASADEFTKDPANSIGLLLSGIRSLLSEDSLGSNFDVNPQLIRRAQDGNNVLLNFAGNNEAVESRKNHKLTPFAALETVFPALDIVTQKAITNSCDDAALADLESGEDERTVMFSLASSIYQILAGKAPLDVLVRSIELLDDKGDPLKKLSELRPSIDTELSDAISNMMALKRTERPSLSDAITVVGSLRAKQMEPIELDLDDELDLLEVPAVETSFQPNVETRSVSAPAPFVPKIESTIEAMPPNFSATIKHEIEVSESENLVDIPNEPAEPLVISDSESSVALPTFAAEQPSGSSSGAFKVAAAAACVVIAGVIAWFALGFGSGTNASASTGSPAPKTEPVAASPELPKSDQSMPTEPAASQNEPNSPETSEPQPKVDDQKQPKRPVVAEVKPQTKPTPAKPEKPKKTVTVDDLISDN